MFFGIKGEETQVKLCPNCGIQSTEGSPTCPNCGQSLPDLIPDGKLFTGSKKNDAKLGVAIGISLAVLPFAAYFGIWIPVFRPEYQSAHGNLYSSFYPNAVIGISLAFAAFLMSKNRYVHFACGLKKMMIVWTTVIVAGLPFIAAALIVCSKNSI